MLDHDESSDVLTVVTAPKVPHIRPVPRPEPRFQQRECDLGVRDQAQREGYTELQALIIANRITMTTVEKHGGVRRAIAPRLDERDGPAGMPDLELAAARIVCAIRNKEIIGAACDHDVDGVSACTVIWSALVRHFGVPAHQVVLFTTNRLVEGYGLSQAFCERVANATVRPSLLITADQGTADEPRIAWLAEQKISTIVTDHHGVPDAGPPPSAYATINPVRVDSGFDATVCGCYVAWVLMEEVGRQLVAAGELAQGAECLDELVDFVGIATLADAVDCGRSRNNRAVVIAGLKRMREQPRACWQAFSWITSPIEENRLPVSAQTLSFTYGPMINARGRMDEAMAGVQCLLARSGESAMEFARMLDAANHERKGVERQLTEQALLVAGTHVAAHRAGLVIYLPDGTGAVHGICASRVVEAYGRPVICLSPKRGEPGVITGSGRSIDGLNLRECMRDVDRFAPGILTKWGGHHAALGLTTKEEHITTLIDAFDLAVRARVDVTSLGPLLWHDGALPRMTLDSLAQIESLQAFGRGFDAPIFAGRCEVVESKWMGDGTHMRLNLRTEEGVALRAVWFNARTIGEATNAPKAEWRIPGLVEVALQPSRNRYKGSDSVQWLVRAVRRTYNG